MSTILALTGQHLRHLKAKAEAEAESQVSDNGSNDYSSQQAIATEESCPANSQE